MLGSGCLVGLVYAVSVPVLRDTDVVLVLGVAACLGQSRRHQRRNMGGFSHREEGVNLSG